MWLIQTGGLSHPQLLPLELAEGLVYPPLPVSYHV